MSQFTSKEIALLATSARFLRAVVGDGAVGEASFDISDDQRSASFDISEQRTQVEAIAEESMDVSALEEAAVPDDAPECAPFTILKSVSQRGRDLLLEGQEFTFNVSKR